MTNKLNIPNHVAIIMDGNRRWAKERNLPTIEGHRRGYDNMRHAVNWFFSRGVKIFSVFAFSTENWNRSPEEVNYLMRLVKDRIEVETETAEHENYRVIVSGRIDNLPGDLPDAIYQMMERTKNGSKGIFNICFNYGGRAEIIDAIKNIIKKNITEEQIHEGIIRKYFYNDLPDPDIIVRTSGEQRLSGFLLWQSAYAELMFMKKYWPEFEEYDVDIIIEEYTKRQRRFGGN